MMSANDLYHRRNPAALVFECPKCGAPPGRFCTGDTAARDDLYHYYLHAGRVRLAEPPKDRATWEARLASIRAALGVTA
jgi:hypothetical protein